MLFVHELSVVAVLGLVGGAPWRETPRARGMYIGKYPRVSTFTSRGRAPARFWY